MDFLALVEHGVDLLFANDGEALRPLPGGAPRGRPRRDPPALRTHRGDHAGAAGSLVVHPDGVAEVPVHPVPGGVVDTTGAGDLYAAGFLYGFTHGQGPADCGASRGARRVGGDLPPGGPAGTVAGRARRHARVVKLPRYRTGDRALDEMVAALVDRSAGDRDPDLIFELIVSAVRLARDHADRGDLKMANAALKEMRYSFHVFEPYRAQRKVAMFGSARTQPDDPLYDQARRLAAAVAAHDWMVITGAGPGIMEAGIEGAGPDRAFGVSIRLPFEAVTSQLVADDPKLVNFRYFFTRKVTFVKEADAFVLLPGGFGTLDEAFELLTLVQTGKAQPGPIVLLDTPGGTYWERWLAFVREELLENRYVSEHDLGLLSVTDDVDVAVRHVMDYFRNYRSQRFVDGRLVLRFGHAPDDETLAALSDEFADIVRRGRLERAEATPAERADHDDVDAERVAFWFDRRGWSRLRELIERLNGGATTP